MAFNYSSHNIEDTRRLGKVLGENARAGDVLALSGELGVGKTALTKCIANGLGVLDEGDVLSPSFNIILSYKARLTLHHIDLYRLGEPQELVELGIEEYIYGKGLSVIEWADLFMREMPKERLDVKITFGDKPDERNMVITPNGERHEKLLEGIKRCL